MARGQRAKGFVDSLHDPSASNVTSVSGPDSTLTIAPTSGAVLAILNLSKANAWLAKQTFSAGINVNSKDITDFEGTNLSIGSGVLNAAASLVTDVVAGNASLTISPTTGNVLASLNVANANTWTAAQTMAANLLCSGVRDLGSSSQGFQTLFLDKNDGVVIELPTAISKNDQSNYTFDMGGGSLGSGEGDEGGRFTFLFDDINSTAGAGSFNRLLFDVGATSLSTANEIIFQADIPNTLTTTKLTLGYGLAALNMTLTTAGSGIAALNIANAAGGDTNFSNSASGKAITFNMATGSASFNSNNANMDLLWDSDVANTNPFFQLDAGTWGGAGSMSIGGRFIPVDSEVLRFAPSARTAPADASGALIRVIPAFAATTIPTGTTATWGSIDIFEPNITATGTVTDAFTVRIVGPPSEGTRNMALWIDDGLSRFDLTDTPTTDPGWATSSSVDMNAPDGYFAFMNGTQNVVVPFWNT